MENARASINQLLARLATLSTRDTALVVTGSIGAAWLLGKILRELSSYLFPNILPGEPNTVLLATPRPARGGDVSADDLTGAAEYDYIIVGTGTAGCVLASRLTEDPGVRVLAIESGHSDLKQLFSRIPAGFGQLFRSAADYDLRTTKQQHAAGRAMQWPRGKMIGGCSSINAMIYNRGAPDDYDEWARLGNLGWAYKDVLPYLNKAETFTQPAEPADRLPADDYAQHGHSGPWQIGYSWISPISRVFLAACEAAGIPHIADFNTRRGLQGASRFQTFIDARGQRSSAATAYLTADVVSRPNLSIASGQRVTRIVFDTATNPPRAVGVEMRASRDSPVRYTARAAREVLSCAGAVHTPALLHLSGVGPPAALAAQGIPLVVPAPHVGAGLADHLLATLVFRVTRGTSIQFLAHPLKSLPHLLQWLRSGTGPMTSNAADVGAFVRSAAAESTASGPTGADIELLAGGVAYIDHGASLPPPADYMSIGPILLRPASRGTVALASKDPFDEPLVDPMYFDQERDLAGMLEGMKLARKVARAGPLAEHFGGWFWAAKGGKVVEGFDADALTDAALASHIRASAETVYHPMCSAAMGPALDAALRVRGAAGLRVVDASAFPAPLACHPCATVVMLAERAADLIKDEYARA